MSCIFCEIVKGNIPSTKVFENDYVLAFRDIEPQAPCHIIIIPKEHIENILEVDTKSEILNKIAEAIKEIAKQENLEKGFRVVTNCGEDGGQTVNHLHFHLLGKRNLQWPPG